MRCQTCATEIPDDSRYCSRCGAELGAVAEHAAVAGEQVATTAVPAPIVAAAKIDARQDGLSGRAFTGLIAASAETETRGTLAPITGAKRLNGPAVHHLLTQANLYRMRGRFTEAVDCCVVVLRAQSSNATAHSLLGDIYRDQGKPDDAIQWYRMALELRPNPSDQAKLAEMERRTLEAVRAGRGNGGRGRAASVDPLAAATGLNTGTSNLMGLSPRRWLRGIWIASLSFLVIVLCVLIVMQSQRHDMASTKNKVETAAGSGFGDGISPTVLPPLDLQHRAATGSTQPTGTGGVQATGIGMPPDQSGAGSQLGRLPERSAPAPIVPTSPAMLPAPVLNVRPLASFAAGGSEIGRAPRDGSVGVTRDTLQPAALTGGLRMTEVRYIGNSTAAVFVAAPPELAADTSDTARELLVRNVYRAARTAFAQNRAYTHATIFIQVSVPAVGGDAVLLEAGVDRQVAIAATPDTDPLSSLTDRLQALKWSAPMVAGRADATEGSRSNNSPLLH